MNAPDRTASTSSDDGIAALDPRVREFLRRLPKADLHCHLIGTVNASTFADLARRPGAPGLPVEPDVVYRDLNSLPPDPALYRNTRVPVPQGPSDGEPEVSYSLFRVCEWVVGLLAQPQDLTRIVFEAFERAHAESTRHLELFVDPLAPHLRELGYDTVIEAYAAGVRMAESRLAMSGCLIQAIDRSRTADEATAVVRETIEHGKGRIIGIGLDNLETAGPPERFVEAYSLAGDAGLFRTAHASEHAPTAMNTLTCLDLLGCDRIDHGYFLLEDDDAVAACRDRKVPFTVISTTSRRSWIPWRKASIRRMLDEGLNVVLATDDPGMFPTTLTREYEIAHAELGVPLERLIEMTLATVDACWLRGPEREALRARFEAEIEALRLEFSDILAT